MSKVFFGLALEWSRSLAANLKFVFRCRSVVAGSMDQTSSDTTDRLTTRYAHIFSAGYLLAGWSLALMRLRNRPASVRNKY